VTTTSPDFFTYLVRCADDTLYCGITTDITRRIHEHNHHKKGAAYTKARRPVFLVYAQKFPDRSLAQQEEARIKKLSKKEKEVLVHMYQKV